MGIALVALAAADLNFTQSGSSFSSQTGTNVTLPQSDFDEDDSIVVRLLLNPGATSNLGRGATVRVTTTPAQFVADGTVTLSEAVPGAATGTRELTIVLDNIITPRSTAAITNFVITQNVPGTLDPHDEAALTAANSGFVQAIYAGNQLASNAEKRDITAVYGPTGNTTTVQVREGTPLPVGAVISNAHDSRFNVLINN